MEFSVLTVIILSEDRSFKCINIIIVKNINLIVFKKTIQNIIKKSQTPFDPFSIRTFERGKEKRFFFIFIKFKINFSIKSRTFIIDAKLVNKECKLLTLFA